MNDYDKIPIVTDTKPPTTKEEAKELLSKIEKFQAETENDYSGDPVIEITETFQVRK